ncbi:MAG: M20/M25/M40 family metallo-hydrolase, partial [Bacteroidia bacterium]|nr:M20/M25/M40 family metallo-hydrolase [Bacteroidia bacterium]
MIKKGIAVLLLLFATAWSYKALMPSVKNDDQSNTQTFSTARALIHVEEMSRNPHGVGTEDHGRVRQYVIDELEKLGLKTQLQEGFSLTSWRNLSKPKNILARIKGSQPGKALLLLSHYDSSPHSSHGASDAASGVATILEGLRAFLESGVQPKNDIIVLISDSEELGLNGADLFVNQHEWAKDVGLVLNFEARGSGGPSYMLIETNGGNAKLIDNFSKAGLKYPVANSLAYSIYKMLPNDTDLTIFRKDGDIDGFNFAFIDDHYDYHTALDNFERLDPESLEHQGQYLMPLLEHFSQANLSNLKSEDDKIYFNMPGTGLVSYPFNWIWPMFVLAILIFGALIFFGFKIRRLNIKDVLKGAIPFIGSVVLCALLAHALYWVLFEVLYPEYQEMLHGFTYNGHIYIAATTFFCLSLCFYLYARFYKPGNTASMLVMPIAIWIIIVGLVGFYLKGASFFAIPVLFALLAFAFLVKYRKPSLILMALLSFPLLMIMSPFVKMFPVGLGLDSLMISGVLIALVFGLLIPVIGFFKHKRRWSVILLIVGTTIFIMANFRSGFNETQPKPNSLVYILDAETNKA